MSDLFLHLTDNRREDGLIVHGGPESVPTMEANSDCEASDELKSLLGSDCDEEDFERHCTRFNENKHLLNPHFELGMEFASPTGFRKFLRNATVLKVFDVFYLILC